MSVKKARTKGKGTAKKSAAKKSAAKKKKGKDIVEVRQNINELVKDSAEDIATSVIEVATRTGQLASAKYLFEAIGLYPATEQTATTPVAGSLAFTLLKRMGLPTEPMILAVNAALYLRRPLLITGKPGTGKSTMIAKVAHMVRVVEASEGTS